MEHNKKQNLDAGILEGLLDLWGALCSLNGSWFVFVSLCVFAVAGKIQTKPRFTETPRQKQAFELAPSDDRRYLLFMSSIDVVCNGGLLFQHFLRSMALHC